MRPTAGALINAHLAQRRAPFDFAILIEYDVSKSANGKWGVASGMKTEVKRRERLWLGAGFVLALVIGAIIFSSKFGSGRQATAHAYISTTSQKKPNIVLITIDTLRQDHLGCYGHTDARTPNLDALFEEGVGFTQANTCVPVTLPSHASILTGLYPNAHGVRDNGSYRLKEAGLTITEALKTEGYSTGAFVSAFVLDRRFGLDKGFDVYDDDFSGSVLKATEWQLSPRTYTGDYDFYQRKADEVTTAALGWLDRNRNGRFFLWVHYFDPHAPYYSYGEGGVRPLLQVPSPSPNGVYSAPYTEKVIGIYDQEITFTDKWIGRLLDAVSEWGLTESTFVTVVSDHGESLGEHDYYFQHGGVVYDTTMKVPLLMRLPYDGPNAIVIDDIVSTVDIAPTIYHMLGIEPEAQIQGSSLIPLMFGETGTNPDHVYAETLLPIRFGKNELRSVKTKQFKLIAVPATGEHRLFDLQLDPGETENLLAQDRKGPLEAHHERIIDELKLKLEKLIRSGTSRGGDAPEMLDEETKQKLKKLGYL
jgi:arylsulfatase A-like enzyme